MQTYIQMHKATNKWKLVAKNIIKKVIKEIQVNQSVIIWNLKWRHIKKVTVKNNEPFKNISLIGNNFVIVRWKWWWRIRLRSCYCWKDDWLVDDE